MENNTKLAYEVVNEFVGNKIGKSSKIVMNESKTGYSYFQGKNRLLKVLKSKKSVKVEINVQLDKEFLKSVESNTDVIVTDISVDLAKKKHLGTMKHILQTNNTKDIEKYILETIKVFKELNK